MTAFPIRPSESTRNATCRCCDIPYQRTIPVLGCNFFNGTVADFFNTGSNTNIENHTPDTDTVGGGWSLATGSAGSVVVAASISSATINNTNGFAIIDAGGSGNVELVSNMETSGSNGNAYLVFRYSDSSNYLRAGLIHTGSGTRTLILEKVDAGTPSTLASQSVSSTSFEFHPFTVTACGDSIDVEYQSSFFGTTTINATNSFNNTATIVGIQSTAGSGTHSETWQDFLASIDESI